MSPRIFFETTIVTGDEEPPTGACCDGSGDCTITTSAGCVGTYKGNGTSCSPNPCLTGACCLPDFTCVITTSADCTFMGGIYQGNDIECSGSLCRCSGTACTNQPTTIQLVVVVTGTIPTSALCNGEEPYEINLTSDSSAQDVTEQDGSTCDTYTVFAPVVPFDITCTNTDCNASELLKCDVTVKCADGSWGISAIDILGFHVCGSSLAFGGEPLITDTLGASPIGAHHYALDDANYPTIHYDITVTIT